MESKNNHVEGTSDRADSVAVVDQAAVNAKPVKPLEKTDNEAFNKFAFQAMLAMQIRYHEVVHPSSP